MFYLYTSLYIGASLSVACSTEQGPKCEYPETHKEISIEANTCFHPWLAWNGINYCAVWQGKYDSGGWDMEIGYTFFDSKGDRNPDANFYLIMKGASESPKVVAAGSDFWLAWENYPDGENYFEVFMHKADDNVGSKIVYRITTNGRVQYQNRLPSLCWNGSNFGLAWVMEVHNSENPEVILFKKIWFRKVSTSGSAYGDPVQITSSESAYAEYPSIVWNSSGYGLAWQDNRSGNYEIYFARLNATGDIIYGSEIRVTNATGDAKHPVLVWNGSSYALAWNDNRTGRNQIYLALINEAGSKTSSDIQISASPQDAIYPSLAWAGDKWALAWHDNRDNNDGKDDVFMTYASISGSKLDADHQISSSDTENWSPGPCLVWNGTKCVLVYNENEGENLSGKIIFCY